MTNLYQPIIDRMFLDRQEDRPPDGFFHPSSLSGCARMTVYEVTGTEPSDEKDVRSIRIMGEGTDMHADIQAEMAKRFPGFLAEVKVDCLDIRGSVDGLLPVSDGVSGAAERWVEEHKTIPPYELLSPVYELQEYKSGGDYKIKMLKRKGAPDPQHVKQTQMYYWALGKMGYLLDGIRIVYFARDDWSVLEFEVEPWDEAECRSFEGELGLLRLRVEDGTLPDRLDQKGDMAWLCRYCDFRTRCFKVDRENERG